MKKVNLEKMTDVCCEEMTLEQLHKEIDFYMSYYEPKRMILDIQQRQGIYSTIYIPIKDFKKSKWNVLTHIEISK